MMCFLLRRLNARLEILTTTLDSVVESLERIGVGMQDQFQQLSDLLDAQKGAIEQEVLEVRQKLDDLQAIIDQIEANGGPAIQTLIEKAQENLQGIKDIFKPDAP
jgi:hypothetical protein